MFAIWVLSFDVDWMDTSIQSVDKCVARQIVICKCCFYQAMTDEVNLAVSSLQLLCKVNILTKYFST